MAPCEVAHLKKKLSSKGALQRKFVYENTNWENWRQEYSYVYCELYRTFSIVK